MVIRKKERDESWLYDENSDVAVPFELTADESEAVLWYYPCVKPLADEFVRIFGESSDTLFSEESATWACERLGAFLAEHGFTLSPDSEDFYNVYGLSLTECEIFPEVHRLTGDENYADLTETDIKGLYEDGYILYGAVREGKIVAVANTCEPVTSDSPKEVEIGVDTAHEYRRMGFGKACVGALIRELTEKGHTVIYECASANKASAALAESFGGRILRKKIYIVGFRDE